MSEEHPSEDRQVERDSQLSAMFDGELSAAECELLARRLTRDEALRAQWSRFAMIGAALRAERGVALNDRIAWRVQSVVAQEPSYGDSAAADIAAANSARSAAGSTAASPISSSGRWMRFARPVMGAGIAAGVAAASIFWLQTQETDSALMADATTATTESIVLQPDTTSPADAGAPITIAATQPEPAPVSSGEPEVYPSTPAPSSQSMIAPPARFANYVVAHSEYSGPLGRRMALLGIMGADSPAEVAEGAKLPAGNEPGRANADRGASVDAP
jgi:sigma-E factor negative regulatory protein RseA